MPKIVKKVKNNFFKEKPKNKNKKQNERVFINNFKGYSSFENELKYPFIEYMSYRLKKYGKNAVSYQEALEEQVLKLGITVPEIIQKEHL